MCYLTVGSVRTIDSRTCLTIWQTGRTSFVTKINHLKVNKGNESLRKDGASRNLHEVNSEFYACKR